MKLHKTKVAHMLSAQHGNISASARLLGVTRTALYRFVTKHEDLRDIIEDARAEILDAAEDRLYDAVKSGEQWAVSLVLRTLGRDRGYTERSEQQQTITVTGTVFDHDRVVAALSPAQE